MCRSPQSREITPRKEVKRKEKRSENGGAPTLSGWGDERNNQSGLKMKGEYGHRSSAEKTHPRPPRENAWSDQGRENRGRPARKLRPGQQA